VVERVISDVSRHLIAFILRKSNKNSVGFTLKIKALKILRKVVISPNDKESHPSTTKRRTQSLQRTYVHVYLTLRSFEVETVIRWNTKTNDAIKLHVVRRKLAGIDSYHINCEITDIPTLRTQPNGHINGGHGICSTCSYLRCIKWQDDILREGDKRRTLRQDTNKIQFVKKLRAYNIWGQLNTAEWPTD